MLVRNLSIIIIITILNLLAISCGSGGVNTSPSASIFRFDFDSGSAPSVYQNTPFSQTLGSVTAQFRSPSDPAAFSIQNRDSTFLVLSQFSGNYLYQNSLSRTNLEIAFSQNLTGITLTFATVEYHGVGEVEQPSAIKLTAYMNLVESTPCGSSTARGSMSTSSYPQGTLSFYSHENPFNLVVIELLYQPKGSTCFLIDNIAVSTPD